MDGLITQLIQIVYHWIKCKIKIAIYTSRAKKNLSFVDHAIALAYECEYEGQIQRDKAGRGEVILDTSIHGIISIHSNIKGTFSISLLDALVVNKIFFSALQELCKQFNQNTEGIAYTILDKDENDCCISITSEIEADPTEKDARYYLSGYIENLFPEKSNKFCSAFRKYKKEHPECQYGAVNYNI